MNVGSRSIIIESVMIGVPIVSIILLIAWQGSRFSQGAYVRSKVDGEVYLVRNNSEKQAAADILAFLNRRIRILLHHLKLGAGIPPTMKRAAQRIVSLYDPNALSENVWRQDEHSSYTLNKGQEIAMCLRDGDDVRFEPINKLMFVLLHEISHVGAESSSEGKHNQEFWDIFSFIYQTAIRLGIYEYEDYNKRPQQYCGVGISKTP